jgi:transposase-like protein
MSISFRLCECLRIEDQHRPTFFQPGLSTAAELNYAQRPLRFYRTNVTRPVHWREFLKQLIDRGLHGVEFIASDAHSGLKEGRRNCFPGVPWQRCQFHLQQNALHYVPKVSMRLEVSSDLRGVFNASDRHEADRMLQVLVKKYATSAPDLSSWMEQNVIEGLTVFSLPAGHRVRMRTTNMLERLNEEVKRRTRVATLFPNEASLLRLVSALLNEVSDGWETGKTYLKMRQGGEIPGTEKG